MIGKITSIIHFAPKKRRINIEVEGKTAKTFIVDTFNNSKNWEEAEVGDILDGLVWDNKEAKIINADSSITVLGKSA